jgi:hypothetical protein
MPGLFVSAVKAVAARDSASASNKVDEGRKETALKTSAQRISDQRSASDRLLRKL